MAIQFQQTLKAGINTFSRYFHRIPAFWLCCFFGLLWTFIIVGEALNPLYIKPWLTQNFDPIVHFTGWLLYQQDRWHLPLTYTNRINYPIGTTTIFTDSIPAFALLFKLVTFFVHQPFQYFGIYFLISSILQQYFGFKLAETLLQCNKFDSFLVSLFFLCSPIASLRTWGHESLYGHWVITAAIYLNIRSISQPKNYFKIWCSLAFLSFLSLGIHFYLASLVILGTMFFMLANLIQKQIKIPKAIVSFVLYFCLLFVSMALWGYLGNTTSLPANVLSAQLDSSLPEFKTVSANLLTFFDSQNLSRFVPGLPASGDNSIGGFGYLGLGFILLFLFCLKQGFIWKTLCKIRPRKILILLLIFLTILFLFSLGNSIYIGSVKLISFKLDPNALNEPRLWFVQLLTKPYFALRATARYIWPVYYFIILFLSYTVLQNFKYRATQILFGLFIFSFIELYSYAPLKVNGWIHNPGLDDPLIEIVQSELDRKPATHLWMLPPGQCIDGSLGGLIAAGVNHLITNDFYLARVTASTAYLQCSTIPYYFKNWDVKNLQQQNILNEQSIYIFRFQGYFAPAQAVTLEDDASKPLKCQIVPSIDALLCRFTE